MVSSKYLFQADQHLSNFMKLPKKHKILVNGTVDGLPLGLIITNIGTASYHPTKHLAKMLSPLSKSQYIINNNLKFIKYM